MPGGSAGDWGVNLRSCQEQKTTALLRTWKKGTGLLRNQGRKKPFSHVTDRLLVRYRTLITTYELSENFVEGLKAKARSYVLQFVGTSVLRNNLTTIRVRKDEFTL